MNLEESEVLKQIISLGEAEWWIFAFDRQIPDSVGEHYQKWVSEENARKFLVQVTGNQIYHC